MEMDALYWEPNWVEAQPEEFRTRLITATAGDRWVTDGNYFSIAANELVWPRADTVVWLDFPRWLVVTRVIRRTFRRSILRTELWSGNRESPRQWFTKSSIIRFAWNEHAKYGRRYGPIQADPTYSDLMFVRLTTPRAVRTWLNEI